MKNQDEKMNQRIEKIRRKFGELGISGFLVMEDDTEPVYIRYLTGTKSEGLLFFNSDSSYLITDRRYKEQAEKEAKVNKIIIVPTSSLGLALKDILKPGEKIGFDTDLPYLNFQFLQEMVPPQITFIPVENLIEELASIKEKEEVAKIRKAIAITEMVFEKHILPQIRIGVSELDLAAEITFWGIKYGAEKNTFDPIILFGQRSSLPHGQASTKKLKKGEIIQFDFGYFYKGYCSDFSRVVIFGKPTKEQKKIYEIVFGAQDRAIEAIKPGIGAKDLAKVAQDFIQENGYELSHGLGHGIGIKIHTSPHIYPKSKDRLKTGQVFTIEPGIYIPGWGGMRIEDIVLVTKKCCEVLTSSPRELIVI